MTRQFDQSHIRSPDAETTAQACSLMRQRIAGTSGRMESKAKPMRFGDVPSMRFMVPDLSHIHDVDEWRRPPARGR
jgi:hypothetical protein